MMRRTAFSLALRRPNRGPAGMMARGGASLSTTAAVASQQVRYNSGGGSGGPTMFQQLDAWFGSADTTASALDVSTTASWGSSAWFSVAESTGLAGGAVLLLSGAVTRLATLYFSLYGDRAATRMQCAMVELKPAYDGFHRIYNSERYKATEIQVEATKVQEFKKAMYAKYQTSNVKSFASILGAPLIMYGFRAASLLSNPVHVIGFGTQTFLWLSLGVPDPTYVLPAISCGLTLLNFELSLSTRENTKAGWAKNVVHCARGAAVCALPVVSMVNSGVLLYWIGMSAVGLLQPLLLRSDAFKAFFKVPEVPKVKFEDPMRERFGMEHPFIHRLLNTETDDNIDMITKATFKQQGEAKMATSGSTPGFSSGLNKASHVPSLGHRRDFSKPRRSLADDMGDDGPITSFKGMAGDMASFDPLPPTSAASTESRSSGASFASAGGSWKKANLSGGVTPTK